MTSYIVRIYRLDKKRRGIVGVVETIGKEVKTAFTTVDELWNILSTEENVREETR